MKTWAACAGQKLQTRWWSYPITQREFSTTNGLEAFSIIQVWASPVTRISIEHKNVALAVCGRNSVDISLFEVMDAGEYGHRQ